MLENLALNVLQIDEAALLGLHYLFILLGGGLAALALPKPRAPMARSWFYFYTALATFLLAATSFIWLLYGPMVKLGLSFLLLLVNIVTALAFGVYYAQICRARSLDAYGHGRLAWLGFIPLFNLLLLFKKSGDVVGAAGSSAAGWAGMILVILARIVDMQAWQVVEAATAALASDPEVNAVLQVNAIRAQGIEAALDDLIAHEQVPLQVAADLTLITVTRNGRMIQYDLRFDDPDVTSVSAEGRRAIKTGMCDALLPFLKAGATGVLSFTRSDGLEIDRIDLSVPNCTV